MTDFAKERADVLGRFMAELMKATGDGSKKRQAGEKPPWYEDDSHEGAVFSHITKWKRGERVDPDSGAHPLVHAAWRCLAIACQETGNIPKGEPPDVEPPDIDYVCKCGHVHNEGTGCDFCTDGVRRVGRRP